MAFEHAELVSHQDYCPGNVVFRAGLPAALIDFDLARPFSTLEAMCEVLHCQPGDLLEWVPKSGPDDRT